MPRCPCTPVLTCSADRYDFNTECYCGPGVEVDDNGTCIGEGSEDNLLGEWGEWWLDLNSPACRANVHEVQRARIRAARAKGCDGLDPDNVDSVSSFFSDSALLQ